MEMGDRKRALQYLADRGETLAETESVVPLRPLERDSLTRAPRSTFGRCGRL